jgi:hypothetical protein
MRSPFSTPSPLLKTQASALLRPALEQHLSFFISFFPTNQPTNHNDCE